jgi:hypothetical protein
MSRPQLTGAGQQMVKTLEEALGHLQHIHGIVERIALAVRTQQPTRQFGAQLQRAAAPLVGMLKLQYAVIADQVTAMTLVATRGGSEKSKVTALREAVGAIRMQLEVAVNKVYEKHAVASAPDKAAAEPGD